MSPKKPAKVVRGGRLSKDILDSLTLLSGDQSKFLISTYLRMQKNRIAASNRASALSAFGKPNSAVLWLADASKGLEGEVLGLLRFYSESSPLGRWAMSNVGVGPVIAAGLLASVDFSKCQTVGSLWSYAGLNPKSKWLGRAEARTLLSKIAEGESPTRGCMERLADALGRPALLSAEIPETYEGVVDLLVQCPWNRRLKALCWQLGECFVFSKGAAGAFYGKVYEDRRAWEDKKNMAGDYRALAEESLRLRKYGDSTSAKAYYSKGQLPPARMKLRAMRYAVKLFLVHYHLVGYYLNYGKLPPFLYPGLDSVPNLDGVSGLRELLDATKI